VEFVLLSYKVARSNKADGCYPFRSSWGFLRYGDISTLEAIGGPGWNPAHNNKYYHRYLAQASRELHNVAMGVGLLFLGFLQRVAVGAGTVFALLLVVWLSTPRRSVIVATRRTMD